MDNFTFDSYNNKTSALFNFHGLNVFEFLLCMYMYYSFHFFLFYLQLQFLQRGLRCTLHTYTHKHTFILRAFDSLSNKSNK